MSGERGKSSFSNLIPELASLPSKPLCHTHMVAQRRIGGDWVTVDKAAARIAQQKKKNHDFSLPNGLVDEPPILDQIRKTYCK